MWFYFYFRQQNSSMKVFGLILIISLLILSGGFFLYFSHFNGQYSSKVDDWANFATFNGYFVNVLTLLILGYISFITYKATNNFNKLQIRPLLYLTVDYPQQIKNTFKDSWYVVNGANYPAINLLVRFTQDRQSQTFSKWVSCTSLSGTDKKELFWVHFADVIEICYSDLTEEKFYLLEYKDYNGKIKPISKTEYAANLSEAITNRANNITHLRDKFEKFIHDQRVSGVANPMDNYTNGFIKPLIFT